MKKLFNKKTDGTDLNAADGFVDGSEDGSEVGKKGKGKKIALIMAGLGTLIVGGLAASAIKGRSRSDDDYFDDEAEDDYVDDSEEE